MPQNQWDVYAVIPSESIRGTGKSRWQAGRQPRRRHCRLGPPLSFFLYGSMSPPPAWPCWLLLRRGLRHYSANSPWIRICREKQHKHSLLSRPRRPPDALRIRTLPAAAAAVPSAQEGTCTRGRRLISLLLIAHNRRRSRSSSQTVRSRRPHSNISIKKLLTSRQKGLI